MNQIPGLVRPVFPFPSNGKVYLKANFDLTNESYYSGVSIPFKRESTSQETPFFAYAEGHVCFHSLQTGKHIARRKPTERDEQISEFPFPSNGKAHRKSTTH